MRRRSLLADARGVTIVEFAAILPVLCLVLIAIFDLGYRSYVSSVLQGSLHEAARLATVGGVTKDDIDALVRQRLNAFSRNAEIVTNQTSYREFSGVRHPEPIRDNKAPYTPGACFEDINGNGVWDADQGAGGLGGAEDIVDYEVSITYKRLFPVGITGWSDTETVSSSTVLRNQPFAARVVGAERICW